MPGDIDKTPLFALAAALCTALLFPFGVAGAKTVVDQTGRTINIPDNPSRVIALAPSITEIVYALGRQDLLRGVTQFSDYPPEAARLPRVGSYVHLDVEKIVALAPDLCIAIKDGNPKQAISRLEELGIPVYATYPTDLATTMNAIEQLGAILNASHAAKALVEDMERRIAQVKKTISSANNKPSVFFQIGLSPVVAAGEGTFIDELITIAGGKNIAGGRGRYIIFSQEELVELSPDIVIITTMARQGMFDVAKKQWERWKNIPAVKNRRIFLIDSNLVDRPTPRLIDGLELLARLIHPKLFEDNTGQKGQ